MNNKICSNCGTANPAEMTFCTNCGQSLSSAGQGAPSSREEPPPTVFMNPASPTTPNQPSFPPPPQQPAASNPPPPKKGGKGWIFGIAGCLGLLVISVVGLAVLAFVIGYNSEDDKGKIDVDVKTPSPTVGSDSKKDSTSSIPDDDKTADTDAGAFLLTILEARKKVGAFDQTAAKALAAADYFPLAEGAAQAEYTNGSKFVYLTIGKFDSLSVATQNFEDQIEGVKSGGGKVTYENTASDGTVSAVYNNSGYFFAEYCNPNGYCNRIHSDNQAALKSFLDSYAK